MPRLLCFAVLVLLAVASGTEIEAGEFDASCLLQSHVTGNTILKAASGNATKVSEPSNSAGVVATDGTEPLNSSRDATFSEPSNGAGADDAVSSKVPANSSIDDNRDPDGFWKDYVVDDQPGGELAPLPGGPVNKRALLILEITGAGFFGVDRFYMGNPNIWLGLAKLLTLSGFGVWGVFDYVVILENALYRRSSINMAGLNYTFREDTIEDARHVAVIGIFIVLGISFCLVFILGIAVGWRLRKNKN
mmetsp:Transcript_52108/g.138863  ORF Transcript_52108/g.138863 Transcript_52108/m.138863 type:complete len:248 (-) Transcript_52108:49-792(-)